MSPEPGAVAHLDATFASSVLRFPAPLTDVGVAVTGKGDVYVVGQEDVAPSGMAPVHVQHVFRNGQRDAAFGENGVATLPLAFNSPRIGARAFADARGGLVIAGSRPVDGGAEAILVRLGPDGRVDASFGQGGYVVPRLERGVVVSTAFEANDGFIIGLDEYFYRMTAAGDLTPLRESAPCFRGRPSAAGASLWLTCAERVHRFTADGEAKVTLDEMRGNRDRQVFALADDSALVWDSWRESLWHLLPDGRRGAVFPDGLAAYHAIKHTTPLCDGSLLSAVPTLDRDGRWLRPRGFSVTRLLSTGVMESRGEVAVPLLEDVTDPVESVGRARTADGALTLAVRGLLPPDAQQVALFRIVP